MIVYQISLQMVMVVALDAAQIVKHVQDFLKIVQAVTLDNFL
jgi:hypothetical protein